MSRRSLHPSLSLVALLSAAITTGCGSGSGSGDSANAAFKLKNTGQGVAATTPLLANGPWLAYLASEATTGAGGTDFNGDGDMIDSIAVRVNTAKNKTKVLDVATQSMALVNRTLFLVVSETADGTNWNLDPDTTDLVLLYHAPGDAIPTYLAELSQTVTNPVVQSGNDLFFVTPTAPVVTGATDLLRTTVSSPGATPSAPALVTTSIVDPNNDGVSVDILGEADGLLFLSIDETVDGELNGDGDALDLNILAMLDGVGMSTMIHGTGTAVDPTAAFDALEGMDEWTVAWLVNETDQGVNLNEFIPGVTFDAAWQPTNCAGLEDVDMTDNILHWGVFSDFAGITPVNTGLVGTAGPEEYVYIHPDMFVGVVSLESDEGIPPGCDFNGDGDEVDEIFRWVDASDPMAPVLPVTDDTKLLALATTIPGSYGDSTGGVVVYGSYFAVLVDEAAEGLDYDVDGNFDHLVATHNPTNVGTGWRVFHGSQQNTSVSATWMADDPRNDGRFLVAFDEGVSDLDLNIDGDKNDSVPTFPKSLTGSVLEFPGFGVAVAEDNAGIATAKGVGYYRVSESDEDNDDLNGDGDNNDYVLQRIGLTTNDLPTLMGTLNNEDMPAVIMEDVMNPEFAALLFQEALQGPTGTDLNGDGDGTDFVVRYFRLSN